MVQLRPSAGITRQVQTVGRIAPRAAALSARLHRAPVSIDGYYTANVHQPAEAAGQDRKPHVGRVFQIK
jgi:hypothetical protein